LEKLARDKHSILLQKFVNYGRNKFYSTGPWSVSDDEKENIYSRPSGTDALTLFLPYSSFGKIS
jgi:hypothetical protein